MPQEPSHQPQGTTYCFFECFTAPEYYLRILSKNFAILSLYYMFSCHLELSIIICTCNVLHCLAFHKNHHTATRNYVLLFAFLSVSQPQNIISEFCLRILQFCLCTTCLAATWNSLLLFVHVLYCIV